MSNESKCVSPCEFLVYKFNPYQCKKTYYCEGNREHIPLKTNPEGRPLQYNECTRLQLFN